MSESSTTFALRQTGADAGCVAQSRLKDPIPQVRAQIAHGSNDVLSIRFEIVRPDRGIYRTAHLLPAVPLQGTHHWGLWEADVVEAFVDVGSGRYFEFVVSPLGQRFELEIFEPRVRTNRDFSSGFEVQVFEARGAQVVQLQIPLGPLCALAGTPTPIRGGLFGIFGPPGQRVYLSAFLPEQSQPDFHRPEYFEPLIEVPPPK